MRVHQCLQCGHIIDLNDTEIFELKIMPPVYTGEEPIYEYFCSYKCIAELAKPIPKRKWFR